MLAIFGLVQFSDIPGQFEVKKRLIQSVQANRVSHALLFTGSAGSGHYALALAFAQYIQCMNPGKEDSCGTCPSCHQAAGLVHPDIHFVFPVARTSSAAGEPVSDDFIEDWRNYLSRNLYPVLGEWYAAMEIENKQAGIFKKEAEEILRKLSFKSYQSDYKAVLFWLPEKMNTSTANKLLKVIEEPADHTVFLFVSENPDAILPTILSRTQRIKVPRLELRDLQEKLRIDFPGQGPALESIAARSQGDYVVARDRIRLGEANQADRERFIRMMRISYGLKMSEIVQWVDELTDLGRERQKLYLTYCLEMLRDNFLVNLGLNELVFFDPGEAEFAARFSKFIHPGNINALLNEFSLSMAQISMNANSKILFTDLCLQIHRLLQVPPAS